MKLSVQMQIVIGAAFLLLFFHASSGLAVSTVKLKQDADFLLFYSGNIQGELEACG